MKRLSHLFARLRAILPDIAVCPARALIFWSLLLCLLGEALSRRSLTTACVFFLQKPQALLYGTVLTCFPLSLSLFFRRRRFVFSLTAGVLAGIYIVNCILHSYRTAPLTAIDIALLPSVGSIMLKYLRPWQIGALILLAAALLVLAVLGWRRCETTPVRFYAALGAVLCAWLCVTVGYPFYNESLNVPPSGENAQDTADRFGYAYCFALSLIDRGIDKPRNYSDETIDSILADLSAQTPEETAGQPNIIFLQLESFFDVTTLTGAKFEEEPLPVFSALEKSCPSGMLLVPSLATGTANTEFEVLTGMSLDFFGMGEYPYQTVLQTETCESMAYSMRRLGYTAHAIHNHSGDFYDRAHVFSNLGFDTFTSVEYMQNVQRNSIGWAKDSVLTAEILKALGSTPGEDFIYAISVQAHGQYPRDAAQEMDSTDSIPSFPEEDRQAAFEYYLSQIRETDAFIGQLIDALERYGRPTVLVLFGDHLPALGLEEKDVQSGQLYATQYVIWSNTGLTAPDRTLQAYQLTAYVQKLLGMQSGLFTRLHQSLAGKSGYQQALELLQYDYLYGDREAFSGMDPYAPTQLQMGAVPIELTGILPETGRLTAYGRGFTPDSRVLVNDREQNCYLRGSTLVCPDTSLEPGDVVRVAQISESSGDVLSSTGGIRYIPHRYASPLR